jgi:hypothetical protein
MVDLLRGFLNRPLSDGDRPRLFATAVALVLAAAAVLALLDDGGSSSSSRSPDAAVSDRLPDSAPPGVEPVAAAEPPSEEGRPPAGAEATPGDVTEAKRAARRFLAGYLPYSYGQGQARAIENAEPELLQRLARERPRVPTREQRRQPRLELVHADGAGHDQARMMALVSDGRRRYTVALELARTASGWHVTSVGS